MAKKDEIQGVQCENADIEILRRQLARFEKMLTDKFTEVNDRIGSIPAQQPVFPPPAEPLPQEPIEVSLPDNLAKSNDIQALAGMIQTLNGTVALVMQGLADIQTAFAAMPKPDIQSVAEKAAKEAAENEAHKVVNELSPKIDNSVRDALLTGVIKSPGISLNDAASIHGTLREIKGELKTRNQNDKVRKTNRWLLIVLMIFFNLSVLFGWLYYDMRQECNGLIRVEWLYRAVRTMVTNPSAIETMEKEIISGTDEQRESWQTTIMEREQDKKPSPFFHHHDDWKPEPPEQKKEQPQPKDTEIDRSIPLPHQRKSRLTPGEIQAIKNMRASPNIPEDAKPELPEGYE